MHLREKGINTRNWVDSAQNRDYCISPFECGIEPPGSISHEVSTFVSHICHTCKGAPPHCYSGLNQSPVTEKRSAGAPFENHNRE